MARGRRARAPGGGSKRFEKTYKGSRANTGVGQLGYGPRSLVYVSDPLAEEACQLDYALESGEPLPTLLKGLDIPFLDKPDGGKRPIELIADPLRIWGKARGDEVKDWDRVYCSESFFYGSEGQGSARAAWDTGFSMRLG